MVCEVKLYLAESQSLKDKRQVLTSLKERLHNRFNLSVAEVDGNELWQRATLAMVVVSTAMQHADEILAKAVNFIQQDRRVQMLDYSVESR